MVNYNEIDPDIRQIVRILSENGVETCQSCAASGSFGDSSGHQDGDEHSYKEPTVEFYGNKQAGLRALQIALDHGLPVSELRRVWNIQEGEIVGPIWAITFCLNPNKLTGWLAKDAKDYIPMFVNVVNPDYDKKKEAKD